MAPSIFTLLVGWWAGATAQRWWFCQATDWDDDDDDDDGDDDDDDDDDDVTGSWMITQLDFCNLGFKSPCLSRMVWWFIKLVWLCLSQDTISLCWSCIDGARSWSQPGCFHGFQNSQRSIVLFETCPAAKSTIHPCHNFRSELCSDSLKDCGRFHRIFSSQTLLHWWPQVVTTYSLRVRSNYLRPSVEQGLGWKKPMDGEGSDLLPPEDLGQALDLEQFPPGSTGLIVSRYKVTTGVTGEEMVRSILLETLFDYQK